MDKQKPEYLRPALIAGAIAGLLSGLPIISAGNCVCCLWIVGGAAMATKLLAKNTSGILTSGDGAIVGALTGIVGAVVQMLIAIPLRPSNIELGRRMLDWLSSLGLDMPSNMDGLLDGGPGILSPGWFLLSLFLSAAVFAVMGVLGGIIGVSLFAKKKPQASSPAATPPLPGPGDAP
jgi:energy-converting hydrogenase Eha subunit A